MPTCSRSDKAKRYDVVMKAAASFFTTPSKFSIPVLLICCLKRQQKSPTPCYVTLSLIYKREAISPR